MSKGDNDLDKPLASKEGGSVKGQPSTQKATSSSQSDALQSESELINRENVYEHSLFGVLYTIGKEKYNDNAKIAVFNIIVDYFQILLFVIQGNFGWKINYNSKLFKWFQLFQLQSPIVAQGYMVYEGIFFVGVALLLGSVGLCLYVAHNFRTNNFPYVWPIKSLRFFVSIFLEAFFISSLNLFLTASDCNIFSSFTATTNSGVKYIKPKGYNDNFETVKCFAPQNIHMFIFGILMPLIAATISALMVTSSAEHDHLTENLQAAASSSTEIKLWAAKALITVFGVVLSNHIKLQGVFLFLSSSYLFYELLRRAPYFSWNMNCLRTALYCALFWCSLMLMLMIFAKNVNRAATTDLMLGGSAVSLVSGWFIMHWRQLGPKRVAQRFKDAAPDFDSVQHKFFDAHEVTIVARCSRYRTAKEEPDKEWHPVAEAIYLRGLEQFPDNAFLNLCYANFLFSVKKDHKAGSIQLAKTRKLKLSFAERFQVFVRDRERKQRSGTEHAGDSAMDLVSYVEFMTNFKSVLQSHTASLKAIRSFWRELLQKNVSFTALATGFHQMDVTESRAEKVYRSVLERYPKSVKLLRTYGRFLEDVKNDPWQAAKYFNEAERIEDIQAEAAREAMITTQGGEGEGLSMVDDTKDAVVVINENGIVQFTNRVLNKLFGYKKGELEGKNVSCLMPQPYSGAHNGYLKNHKTAGRGRILNRLRKVVAIHKQRHVFPISLLVTRIQQGDSIAFMGVIKEVPDTVNDANVYITPQGVVVCANRGFADMFGWKGPDLVGRNLRALAADPETLDRLIRTCTDIVESINDDESDIGGTLMSRTSVGGATALKSTQSAPGLKSTQSSRKEAGATLQSIDQATLDEDERSHERVVYAFDLMCRHKYGALPFKVSVSVTLAGTSNARLLVLHLKQADTDSGVVAMNEHGLIQYCSASIEQGLLGNQAGALTTGSVPLGKILPFPYTVLHQQFVEQWALSYHNSGQVQHRPISCAAGRIVPLYARGGRLIPCHLKISMLRDGPKTIYSANVSRVSYVSQWEDKFPADEVLYNEFRLRLLVRGDGKIVLSDAPGALPTQEEPTRRRSYSGAGSTRSAARLAEKSARAAAFGYFKSDLEGMNLLDLVDVLQEAVDSAKVFAASTTAEQVIPPLLKKLDQHSEFGGIYSWKVGVASGPARRSMNALPTAMTISSRKVAELSPDRMEEEGLIEDPAKFQEMIDQSKRGGDTSGLYVVDLYRFDMLQGVIELEKTGRIRRADRAFGLLFGRSPESFPAVFFMNMLMHPPPQSRLVASLGLKAGKQLGERTPVELQFVDQSPFRGEVLLCARNEDATRIQGLVHATPNASYDVASAYRKIQEVLQRPIKVVHREQSALEEEPTSAQAARKLRFGEVTDNKGGEATQAGHAISFVGMAAAKRFGKTLRAKVSASVPSVVPEEDLPQPSPLSGWGARGADTTSVASGTPRTPQKVPPHGRQHRPGSATTRPSSIDRGAFDRASVAESDGLGRMGSHRSHEGDLMTLERMTSVGARSDMGDELTVDNDDLASMASSVDQEPGAHASDFKRARRFRRLNRLLTSVRARRSQVQLTASSRIAAILVLLVHIGVFVAITMLVTNQKTSVLQLATSGEIMMRMQSTVASAYMLASSLHPNSTLGSNATRIAQDSIVTDTMKMTSALDQTMQEFVASKVFTGPLQHFSRVPTAFLYWFSLPQGLSQYVSYYRSTWDLARDFIHHALTLALPPADINQGGAVEDSTSFRYVLDGGKDTLFTQFTDILVTLSLPHVVDGIRVINTTSMLIYLIEGTVVIPFCALLMYIAVRNVMNTRISLFSTFLVLPRPMVMHLATKRIKLDEEDSGDEADDDIEFERIVAADEELGKKATAEDHTSALSGFSIAKVRVKRKLQTTQSREMGRLLSPFMFYCLLLLILSGVSSMLMRGAVAPLAALTEAESLFQLTSRVVMFSEEIVYAAETGDNFSFTSAGQALNTTLDEARSTYRMVLLGNKAASLTVNGTTDQGQGISSAKTQSIIQKKKYQTLLFGLGCLRAKTSPPCPAPGSTFSESTQRGLDTAWQAFLTAAESLVSTPMPRVTRSDVNYLFIQEAGRYDLRDGMTSLRTMFEADNLRSFDVINYLGIGVFVIILIGSLIYLVATRPFIRMVAAESKRVAELLSLLPEDVDVEGLVISSGGIASEDKRVVRKAAYLGPPWWFRWLFWLDWKINGRNSVGFKILSRYRSYSDSDEEEEAEEDYDSDDFGAVKRKKKRRGIFSGMRKSNKVVPVDSGSEDEEGGEDAKKSKSRSKSKGKKRKGKRHSEEDEEEAEVEDE